jgi:transcriptional regulator with XRE-family HTH domain
MSKPTFRIKEIAKDRGITIDTLASKMGIGLSALSQSINGNPTAERLQQIADALGVDITELFDKPSSGNFTCPNCGAELKLNAEIIGKE